MPAFAIGRWLRFVRWPQWYPNKSLLVRARMGTTHPRYLRILLLVLGIIIFYGLTVAISNRHAPPADWDHRTMIWDDKRNELRTDRWPMDSDSARGDGDFDRIFNRTLGFEKVYTIGLRERTDKRDAMALMSSLTGFDIDWVEGVRPGDIPDKAVPFGIDVSAVRDNFLGSWRGHMNVIRNVVEQGISSALIMEDDMDWDVYIKSQLQGVARGARRVFPEKSRHPNSPYGDNWDILWLGHCGEPFPETLEENTGLEESAREKMATKYLIQNDNTVPPYSKVSHLVDWEKFPKQTRIVHMSAAPICSFAYAVSQKGARKLLHALSVDGLHMAFDNSLAQICRDAVFDFGRDKDGGYDAKCISVNPTMMFHHKARGLVSADSDIQSYGKGGDVRETGMTESIMWSTRMNLKNLVAGKPPDAQFKED